MDTRAGELVSVIVPTLNRAHCIVRVITRILSQTYQTVEAIEVDRGPADRTIEEVRPPELRSTVAHDPA